ncbi:salicylate hydroxylase [Amycolatopsis bartoniae]|uniref:Salicylate hydroxylase n=1 Tax=Amycolatopsis bartoniae TaxID=941986 RepID=A0A8H9ITU6_9PSEU|nr:FAD-dependent monooxygenase [Amycolatopsis bartoniae]MBB2937868.1 salicylate hydroxylase [Amycolatopsis bartoniae]GHF41328.1 salicylate hydroxylase [Amycolatopsis bartoniae]
MRIVVVGGGIGGLTTALALLRAGHEVRVVERAGGFGEIGAGVQTGPNATRVLRHLGLADALEPVAVVPVATRFLRWDDDAVLTEWPLAENVEKRFGAPYHTLYRPDLIAALAGALPPGVVGFGRPVTAVESWETEPVVRFADGSAETADVVVGADGIHSAVRKATVPETAARFSRMCAYRALVPADALPSRGEPVVRAWLGPNRHLVAYPVGRGGRYVNLVCVVPAAGWSAESWTAPGSVAELRAQFEGWSPRLTELLDAVREPVYRWGLYDREPLSRWSTPSTTLVGDACHPMLPFLAQGAAQAIEDAVVLARSLTGDRAAGLAAYEAERLPHTALIQRQSWANNVRFHLPDGPGQRERDAAMTSGEIMSLDALSPVLGHDAVTGE